MLPILYHQRHAPFHWNYDEMQIYFCGIVMIHENEPNDCLHHHHAHIQDTRRELFYTHPMPSSWPIGYLDDGSSIHLHRMAMHHTVPTWMPCLAYYHYRFHHRQ